MNIYHTGLSLPNNVFKEGITVHNFSIKRRTVLIPYFHINPEVIKIITDVGLRIGQADLFYSQPDMTSGIHRDTMGSDISKINWIYQGHSSVMNWYDTDPEKPLSGPSGYTYKAYSIEESKLLHQSEIHSPSLVQAAIAHNVINYSEPRWAVSLMLFYKENNLQCKYSDALERFKNYILSS